MARAAESSQFERKRLVTCSGRTSVWPSTRITQLISGGICALELEDGVGELVELALRTTR